MDFVVQLFGELRAASKSERSIDPFSFPEDTRTNDEQEVQPVCSTFTEGQLVNIYRVIEGKNPLQYIYSTHGDEGVVCGFGGPYASVEAAQAEFDPIDEGWTEY